MRKRLTWTFIGIAFAMVSLASIIFLIEMHVHVSMFESKFPLPDSHQDYYDYHLQQALIQSTVWTAIGTILLAILVSLYVARRIASPLIEMRHVAEQMARGHWESRVNIDGNDELANLGLALNQLTSQLQEHDELRKNLTSDVAHELRTPLATLKSHMEAFEDGIWKPTPDRIKSCQEELERLIHLVGDLEQLTNVESPNFTLDRKKVDLVELIYHVYSSMETNFTKKGVKWRLEVPKKVSAWVDRNRISQIMINLLSNSLTYTPSGGSVTVKLTKVENRADIAIQDTGIGIPASDLELIFERFYRVDKSRNRSFGGSGIGLTIVKKLVDAHGGSIQITSEEKQGTYIMVSLPTAES